MTAMTSNKPYLIRAFYDWIVDNNLTPYLLVDVRYPGVQAPLEFATDNRIVFNISPKASRGLVIENDKIIFTAKFSGQATQVMLPPAAVLEIYAKENGRGISFPPDEEPPPSVAKESTTTKRKKPFLKLVD